MTAATFVLLLMYWGSDGRVAMTSSEFNSQRTCEAAKIGAAKVMDGAVLSKTYAVCVEK